MDDRDRQIESEVHRCSSCDRRLDEYPRADCRIPGVHPGYNPWPDGDDEEDLTVNNTVVIVAFFALLAWIFWLWLGG